MKVTFVFTAALCLAAVFARALPVAVWDTETSTEHGRFHVEAAYGADVRRWLSDAGVDSELLTAAAMSDASAFTAERYAAVMLQGGVLPAVAHDALLRFLDGGGVLVALNGPNFMEIRVAQGEDGSWAPFPAQPNFAWQTPRFDDALGIQFDTSMDNVAAGVRHTVEPPLAQFLPASAPREVRRPVVARWYLPKEGTRFYPLVRSRQPDGSDSTPQILLAVRGGRRAIFVSSGFWTAAPDFDMGFALGGQFRSAAFRPGAAGSETAEWPCGRETVVALAKLAVALRERGDAALASAEPLRQINRNVATPCLQTRGHIDARGSDAPGADPDGVKPLARWGRFDGTADSIGAESGESLLLALPDTVRAERGPCALRIRGAAPKGARARLRVALDSGATLWDEELVLRDAGDRYKDTPLEFMRLVLVPAGALADAKQVVLGGGAGAPVYDAVQLERFDAAAAPQYELGCHTSVALAYDGKRHGLTAERCRDWSALRCTTRVWWVGAPGEEGRWERFDRHVERYLALHPRCQFILEGTPEWAAVSPERWARGGRKPHMSAPKPEAYEALTERIVSKYADRVQDWEIGNETTVWGFWNGTAGEYADHFLRNSAIVRRLDPGARVIVAGMAGVTRDTVDPFILAMSRGGALSPERADLFGVHCYAPNGMWDIPHGLAQGHLFALGENIEIFANEQGNTIENGDLGKQARNNDRGTARLLSSGVTKLIVFQSDSPAGRDSYGILDEKGEPRPAYASFRDYLRLAADGGRRVPVSLVAADGASPLRGVYAAAAQHGDGSLTLVLNPADVEAFQPAPPPGDIIAKAGRGRWVNFFGKVEWTDASARVTSEFTSGPKDKAGFFRKIVLDPSRHPEIEVKAADVQGSWQLMVKGGGRTVDAIPPTDRPGTFRVNFGRDLGVEGPTELEISFRVKGAATFESVTFPEPTDGTVAAPKPVDVIVRLPLPEPGAWTLDGGAGASLALEGRTAIVRVPLRERTVLRAFR